VDVAWEYIIKPTTQVVARVNGEEISAESYLAELRIQLHYVTEQYRVDWYDPEAQQLLPSFQDEILRQMEQLRLAEQLAKAENAGISADEVEAEAARTKQEIMASGVYNTWEGFLAAMGLTDETFPEQIRIQMLFNKLLEAHGGPDQVEQVHAAHILVASEETGREVLAKLKEGKAFSELAKTYSTDTGSKDNGGDLGWFPQGTMVPEFEAAAFALKPGETSDLVKTDFGYHIIQVLGREVRALDPEMLQSVRQKNFQTWFEAEMAKAKIETLVQFEQPVSETTPTP
jgi:parvulin-like peptidyl-prolyl isomerase